MVCEALHFAVQYMFGLRSPLNQLLLKFVSLKIHNTQDHLIQTREYRQQQSSLG